MGAKSSLGLGKAFGSKPCVGCVPESGMKVVSFWAEAIRCSLAIFLDGLWVNLFSLLCKKGWTPFNIYSGFCGGFFGCLFLFGWFFLMFVCLWLVFLAQSAKLFPFFPVWGADFIGVFLISIKPEISWEYSIKVNNIFLKPQNNQEAVFSAWGTQSVPDRDMWKPLLGLIAFMICSIWDNLFSVPSTISFCSSK